MTEDEPRKTARPSRARRELPDHPIRLALLDLLAEKGTATATEAAARLGHSSGLCSFHLRQLARHGLVEEAPHSGGGRGGPRPWRLRWEDPRVAEAGAAERESGGPGPYGTGMDPERTAAYLRRIGAARPAAADADTLRELHRRHLVSVPFENLSIHLGEDIVLSEDALVDKIVGGRGGFCYELNGAFGALLRSLGFGVELLAARGFGEGGRLGPPYDHMALRVTGADGGGPWLADVGFGRHSTFPLDYAGRAEQRDPGGRFRVADAPDGDLDVLHDGTAAYRLEQRPRELGDFEATCWYQRSWPGSYFRRSPVCSRLTDDGGRTTLSGRTLVRTDAEGHREERELDEGEVLPAYREHFGITLDREPVAVRDPQT